MRVYLNLLLENAFNFLHELGHSTGSRDGDREFSDLLTYMLEQALDKAKS